QHKEALLTWKNPSQQFDYVRIVKSETFFPSNPYDGTVLYEGSAQSFFDSNVREGVRYFYTLFVRKGNEFSSGALHSFMIHPDSGFFGETGHPVTIFGPIYDSAVISNIDS